MGQATPLMSPAAPFQHGRDPERSLE